MHNIAKTVIAQTRVYLDNNCFAKECNLGNLIADAMVDAVRGEFVPETKPINLLNEDGL